MSGKYVPPHLRKTVSNANNKNKNKNKNKKTSNATRRNNAPKSATNWLKNAQKGYTAKSTNQLKQNYNSKTYAQLKAVAAPIPKIIPFSDYFDDSDFNKQVENYKKGVAPPPNPRIIMNDLKIFGTGNGMLQHIESTYGYQLRQRTESIRTYTVWWNTYGNRLTQKWNEEHGYGKKTVAAAAPAPAPAVAAAPAPAAPKRTIVPASNQSGW